MQKQPIIAFLCFFLASNAVGEQPPNIVFIISDDQAWTDYGFMGHPHVETPNLDRLASRSAVFKRGYVPTALCRPSLATLITGKYAHQHKISGNDPALLPTMSAPGQLTKEPEEYRRLRERLISHIDVHSTLPKLLAEKGFVSHQSGKWWEGNYARGGFTEGMTRGFPQPGGRHGDDGLRIGREGMQPILEFMNRRADDKKPFFLWYAPFLPHTPHNPPDRLFVKYKDKGIVSDHVARYYAMIEWFDESCGQLLDHLDYKRLSHNTLVVYVGDNGWIQQPDEPRFAARSKQSANEGGTRQPTMFCWPGVIPPGDRGQQLCSSVDIVPTALAAAGVDVPKELPGYNLLPVLKTGHASPRSEVFGETFAHDVADIDKPEASLLYRWVIDSDWKLILTYDGLVGRHAENHPREDRRPQLYDLSKDPHEHQNLADKHPDVVKRLADKLQAWWPVKERKAQTTTAPTLSKSSRPNILFISIDDQNDWIGCMGGHPLAKTPNLDRLAAQGTLFLNAHCQSPLCNPSRTSLLLGLRPTTTGIYGLEPWFRTIPQLQEHVTLPQYFANFGYRTLAAGKIFHTGTAGPRQVRRLNETGGRNLSGRDDPGSSATKTPVEFQKHGPSPGIGARPERKLIPPTPMGNHPLMDWGVFPHRDEDKGDYQVASWAVEQILAASKEEPFFLAAGFFLPHVPCYATQPWFDLYPDDDSLLPAIREEDRDDTPRFSWYLHWSLPEPRLKWIRANDQWRNLVRSYLACTSFVDAQIGRILNALEKTGLAENSIVVVWGDHGWHLGEKLITGKNSLWDDGTRVPLIVAGPGVAQGQRCTQPAELLDIYPTLIELCGLPARDDLDGISLRPQLQDADSVRARPAITSHNQGNHGIRSQRWRFIRYADGSEELYDTQQDPNEWNNLIATSTATNNAELTRVLEEHRRWLPQVDRPPVPGSAHRILTYEAGSDTATWEGGKISRDDPIPE
jgi:choline-sulfatase